MLWDRICGKGRERKSGVVCVFLKNGRLFWARTCCTRQGFPSCHSLESLWSPVHGMRVKPVSRGWRYPM
ncbi:hypothetical protein OFB79_24395, partial [Escherichia coli]|nr:hypothetical protein [Escherichia coli]